MAKFTYIVAYLENSNTIDDIFENIQKYKNLTKEKLIDLEFLYLVEYIDEYGVSKFSTSLDVPEIRKYKKMSDLILDYFSSVVDDEFNDDPFMLFLEDFIVLKKDNKIGTYSIVEQDKLFNCYIQMFDPIMDENSQIDNYLYSNIVNFDKVFLELTNKLDTLVEGEYEMLVSAGNKNNVYQFTLIKQNSSFHKLLKKENVEKLPEPDHNGIIYECGYEDYKNFLRFNLMKNGRASVLLSSKVPGQKMYKKYAFLLMVDEYDELALIQFDAKKVSECFDDVDKSDIYCGTEKDDLIFGFDLI